MRAETTAHTIISTILNGKIATSARKYRRKTKDGCVKEGTRLYEEGSPVRI